MSARTILVAEDNPITRKMLRHALESDGYRVLEAGDGRAALAAAAGGRPDLLVLDYVLPDTDGIRLLGELRGRAEAPELPALLLTGIDARLDELGGPTGVATQLFPKPIEPSRLLEVVRALLLAGDGSGGGRGKRVLVVDDEPLNLKLAALCLRNAGYQVETASGGTDGLDKARRAPPDAILSDVLMPAMDGFTFCAEARRDPRLTAIPVVLVSAAYVEEADQELGRKVGADALVLRSADLKDAMAALERALRGEAARPSQGGRGPLPAALHRERIVAQLEHQTVLNQALLHQAAIHAAVLSVMWSVSEVLAQPQEVPRVIGEVLVQCLDVSGLSTGLLYLIEPSGYNRLHAQAGIPAERRDDAEACFGHPQFIRRIAAAGEIVALSASTAGADPESRELLASLGRASTLLVPFVVLGQSFGLLVLASDSQDLEDSSWIGFGRGLAAQFGQTVALGQSLSRLATSEERHRALMEQANDAILLLDLDGRILEANRQAQRLLGRPAEEVVGRHYDEFVVPEERDDAARSRASLLELGTERVGCRHFLRSDGTRAPADVSASLVRLNGETAALAIIRDITERQRAEKELLAAQRRLQHVVSSNPAVLYALRCEGEGVVATWVSDNIVRLTGDTPQEALSLDWWPERLHPDDRGSGRLPALLAAGSLAYEFRLRHKRGHYLWIRAEQVVVRDAAGEPVEIVGSWSDVTARQQIELRLQQSEEQYRLLFDNNPQPMWVYDDETLAFLAVNDAALEHYGYTRDEMLAMTVRDIRPPAELPVYEEHLAARRMKGVRKSFRSERVWKHRKKDGSLADVEIAASPIEFHGRQAWLALASDVTEKKRLEAQFLQAQKMESVGRLAGGVAHDFNNLLTAILGYSELLSGRLAGRPDLHSHVEEIRKAGERAAGLTRQLLAFSRKQVLQPRVVDLNAVVADTESLLRRLIGENIELVTRLRAESGRVLVDPGQLEQVIVNLAVNARDAMPEGGRLALETADLELDAAYVEQHPYARSGPHVVLAVSDTGHGMDAETRAHVFEPFFTTKEQGKGTGLGLSTVYGIVRQSGGHLEFQSETGQGTTFSIYLPRAIPEAERGRPKSGAEAPAAPSGPGGAETVLLLEDEAALRTLIRTVLGEAGYKVLEGESAEAALALAREHRGPIHLLLSDVIMPGMSGPDLAERLAEVRPEMRVLFMSGHSRDLVGAGRAAERGAPFLEKPFRAHGLLRKVREVLDAPTS